MAFEPRLTRAQKRELAHAEAQQQLSDDDRRNALPPSVADLLQREAPGALDQLTPDLRRTLTTVPMVTYTTIAKLHSGPLPATEDMTIYAQLIPDGGNRIMAMAERQQEHRILLETTVATAQLAESARGQTLGFVVCLAGMIFALVLILCGHSITGSVFAGSILLSLVSLFVLGRKSQMKSLAQKRPG